MDANATTSTALWYRRFGAPEAVLSLETRELGPLAPGQARVRMALAPINPSDLVPITGAYSHRVAPPRVAGYEGVGRLVEASGPASALIGRRVLPLRGAGTWQSLVDCEARWLVPVPDDIDDGVAARAYINPLAAHLMLRRWSPAGKRVVVTAAGSTCARLLAQWALRADASEVVGIHRAPDHRQTLLDLGVTPVAEAQEAEIAAHLRSADLVFDALGGPLGSRLRAGLRPDAGFISYGLLSGQALVADGEGPKAQRFHIRDGLDGLSPSTWQQWFRDLWPLLRTSRLPEAQCFGIRDWRQALVAFGHSGRRTKPVLSFGAAHSDAS